MAIQTLQQTYLCRDLTPEETSAVEAIARLRNAHPGERLFVEGEPPQSLFILESGTVRISKGSKSGTDETVATLGNESVFGEIALVDRSKRSATAETIEACRLIEIPFQQFDQLAEKRPAMASKIYRSIARLLSARLRETSQNYSELRGLTLQHL